MHVMCGLPTPWGRRAFRWLRHPNTRSPLLSISSFIVRFSAFSLLCINSLLVYVHITFSIDQSLSSAMAFLLGNTVRRAASCNTKRAAAGLLNRQIRCQLGDKVLLQRRKFSSTFSYRIMETSGFTEEQMDVRAAIEKICSDYPDVR